MERARSEGLMDASGVKALIFDVFGTVVDWRTSIIEHGRTFGRIHGVEADWGAFADAWRGKYQPFMDRVRTGELPWTNLDGCTGWPWRKSLSSLRLPA